jgi:hypothetical protein
MREIPFHEAVANNFAGTEDALIGRRCLARSVDTRLPDLTALRAASVLLRGATRIGIVVKTVGGWGRFVIATAGCSAYTISLAAQARPGIHTLLVVGAAAPSASKFVRAAGALVSALIDARLV